MSKAEERALEAYPKISRISEPHGVIPADNKSHYLGDGNEKKREAFIEGYHQAEQDLTDKAKVSSGWDGFYYGQGYKQAEKDLELTWEDIRDICRMWMESKTPFGVTGEALSIEVLKRFKAQKEGEKISDIKSGDKN